MKGTYVFLADGFEVSEALTTVNMLRRGGVNVKTVSIYDDRIVTSSNRIPVIADMAFGEFKASTTFGPWQQVLGRFFWRTSRPPNVSISNAGSKNCSRFPYYTTISTPQPS